MTSPRNTPEDDWLKRLELARRDQAPEVDLPALLRAVRREPLPRRQGWLDEFVALFNPRRAIPACAVAACLFALTATWLAYDWWEALPWAAQWELTTGGES
ncbi:hypothetical protein DB347_03815 [Opitutaceae bacterium EW11]|nr:hypothetical protein DB347_03815 [Opitutaceae bacterium EW11]